jgi:aspartyl-tRNA(Asn)/glutamyl-tRNA(Gln) amidotransferase subunit B
MRWEPVIGLEIHVQLATGTKMFCGCAVRTGAPPNTLVCPVCLGLPGALPVVNSRAVDLALLASLALGCRVPPVSVFARKNYFYPDLPKGYQISQFDRPLAVEGALEWTAGGRTTRVGIVRLHLEEDAGKSLHEGFEDSDTRSYLDFNRSGVPLAEIVTAPDLRSAADAAAFFERLRAILVELHVTGGSLDEGHMRCDANVSVRPAGDTALGAPVEVKNLNSFRYLEQALAYEIGRQSAALEAGRRVARETRQFDEAAGVTIVMRSKEQADDYRYFPEPDLPPLIVTADRLDRMRAGLTELPEARRRRLIATHGLSENEASLLAATPALTVYFERVAGASRNGKAAANWITGEVTRHLHERRAGIEDAGVTADALAELIALVDAQAISTTIAKRVFEAMWGTGRRAAGVIAAEGWARLDDEAAIAEVARAVIGANPKVVAEFKAGKAKVFGFFVGRAMAATGGRANPELLNRILRRELERA